MNENIQREFDNLRQLDEGNQIIHEYVGIFVALATALGVAVSYLWKFGLGG